MEPENKDDSEVLETTETEETTDQTAETTEETVDEEKEALRRENEELKKKNSQLYERAKKKEQQQDGLSVKDTIYLAKADIPAEDVDEVLLYAKKMGVSVQDAHNHFKPIIKERVEERKSASVAATGKQRVATQKVSEEEVWGRARQGDLPEDDEGIRKLAESNLRRK